jgi:hypothetical protein
VDLILLGEKGCPQAKFTNSNSGQGQDETCPAEICMAIFGWDPSIMSFSEIARNSGRERKMTDEGERKEETQGN